MAEHNQLQDNRAFWWACVDIAVLRDPAISMSSKAIYAVLCTYASTDGKRSCFPSVALLAESAGCSERTVQRSLEELVKAGYVMRQERYRDNTQITSLYSIVGHRRPEKQGGCQIVTRGVQICHPELEPINYKDLTLSEGAAAPIEPMPTEREIDDHIKNDMVRIKPDVIQSKIPAAMKETVEFLMLKTGRDQLLGEELGALLALEKQHMPARVQKEISTAVRRYELSGRALTALTFCYIWDSMKYQKPTKRFKDKHEAPVAKQAVVKTEEDIEYERLCAEKFGGGTDAPG